MPRSARDSLIIPVAVVLTIMWAVSGFAALYTGRSEVFLAASAPFVTMCGWLFVRDIFRRADEPTTGGQL